MRRGYLTTTNLSKGNQVMSLSTKDQSTPAGNNKFGDPTTRRRGGKPFKRVPDANVSTTVINDTVRQTPNPDPMWHLSLPNGEMVIYDIGIKSEDTMSNPPDTHPNDLPQIPTIPPVNLDDYGPGTLAKVIGFKVRLEAIKASKGKVELLDDCNKTMRKELLELWDLSDVMLESHLYPGGNPPDVAKFHHTVSITRQLVSYLFPYVYS